MSDINCWEGYNTAVYIKNLTKSYDNEVNSKELVLNKFCMRVKKGSMFVKINKYFQFYFHKFL